MKKYLICLFSYLVVLDVEAVTSRAGRAVPTPVMLPVGMGSSARQRQGDFKTGPIPLQNEAAPVVPVLMKKFWKNASWKQQRKVVHGGQLHLLWVGQVLVSVQWNCLVIS